MKSFISCITVSALVLLSAVCHADKAIIVSKNNPNSSIAAVDVQKIYLAKTNTFPNGGEVVPVSQDEKSDIYTAFLSAVIQKTPEQYKSYWAKMIFTGQGQPPKQVSGGDAAVVKLIAENPALIGYVDAASVNDSVKVLSKF
jgi:ABC-type phosphate transport system substrate-binding protein